VKKLAIVGGGPSLSNYDNFYQSLVDEVWALKETMFKLEQHGFRVDMGWWIEDLEFNREKHPLEMYDEVMGDTVEPWMHPYKVMVSRAYSIPGLGTPGFHVRYPLQEVIKYHSTDYMNNLAPFAIAYAIYTQNYGEIHLHGVDCSKDVDQPKKIRRWGHRACTEYWIGRAEGAGITVKINPISPMTDKLFQTLEGSRVRGILRSEIAKLPTTREPLKLPDPPPIMNDMTIPS